jgi:UDP-N-acetylmuramoylalanine--D-glutamate ligase
VVGLGRSGAAAARLAAADGAEVVVTDRRSSEELVDTAAGLPTGSEVVAGGHPASCLDGVELVIVSPGVSPDIELLERARDHGLTIATEVEFAWWHRSEAPLAAVTGSNGKSTVTTLIARMLVAGGFPAVAGGNLGTAASDLVLAGGWDRWVLEISSFQSELLTAMAPTAAVFLNLSQDHLERHADLESYLGAKRQLFAYQGPSDTAVLNADDPASTATTTAARRRWFSLEREADAWFDGRRLVLEGSSLIDVDQVKLSGTHNLANILAAALAARALAAPVEAIADAAATFDGLAHRHRTVYEADGVKWIDDSKATNVGATLAALKGHPDGSLHLILGGQGKGQDFTALADEVSRAVARLYVIGVDGPTIASALTGSTAIERCETLSEAVDRARRKASPGQSVLLAPACASFDQFSGFDQRGDVFAGLARGEEAGCP